MMSRESGRSTSAVPFKASRSNLDHHRRYACQIGCGSECRGTYLTHDTDTDAMYPIMSPV